jgi:hypothetical protein
MFTTTYTFTNPNFDISFFYSVIDDILPHFNLDIEPVDLFSATPTFLFTSDTQQNLDNFISYLNGNYHY